MTERIVSGIGLGESLRWRDGRLWFCDWLSGRILVTDRNGSEVAQEAALEGFPLCIDWDRDGKLLAVTGSSKMLLRDEGRGLEPFADLSPLSDRPWNEVVGHPSGNVYVNGVGFDMMAGEAPTSGQIALVDAKARARVVADELQFPNGMALSSDGATLVVAESHAGRVTAYTVEDSGDLAERRTFAEIPGSAPDGISFARDGTLWYADVPNRHCRRVEEGGEIVETVEVDRGCFSCAASPNGEVFVAATVWDSDTFSTQRGVIYRISADQGLDMCVRSSADDR